MAGSVFAIGDIHGCADELQELLDTLPLRDDSVVVTLGDYVDRGPESRRVIDILIEARKKHRIVTLVGNHEEMLREFLDGSDPVRVARFIMNGGSRTLATYATENGEYEIPMDHVRFFMDELVLWFETETHFFVHAGVPDRPLSEIDPERDREDMLWIRRGFIQNPRRWEKRIVHGHTPVDAVEVSLSRINIDTACAYGGFLTAIELPSHRIYSVRRKVAPKPGFLRDLTSRRAAIRFLGAVPVRIKHGMLGNVELETINYSEIGMLVRASSEKHRVKSLFDKGDEVRGIVGVGDDFSVPFSGHVVHARKGEDGWEYGLAVELHG